MHRRREGAGIDVILQQQDRHSINGSESDTGKYHKRGIPVGIFDVCFSDAPWQGRHACMHRRREGAGVDVILKQQHLCLSILVAYCAQGTHIVPGGIG